MPKAPPNKVMIIITISDMTIDQDIAANAWIDRSLTILKGNIL